MTRGAARNNKDGSSPKKGGPKKGKKLSRSTLSKKKKTTARRKAAYKVNAELHEERKQRNPKIETVGGKSVAQVVAARAEAAAGSLDLVDLPREPLTRTVSKDGKVTWKIAKRKHAKNEGLVFAAYVFNWIETYLEIRTKEGKILPLRYNHVQQLLAQFVARQWGRAVPVKLVTPKSRQQGSSTFWQTLFFALCELLPGYRVMVVAHDEAGSREVFSRAFTALRRLRTNDEWPDPTLITEQQALMIWETESAMQSGTIKTGDAIGRGGTLSAIHFSESANFADRGTNAKGATAAVMNSLAETRWTICVHESTANGKDGFFFPKCEDARDPSSGSAFTLIFLPWFLTPEYAMPWQEYRRQLVAAGRPDPGAQFAPSQLEDKLRQKLAKVRVRKGQETWRYKVELTDAQLVWRRWAIMNKCEADEEQFKREYPSTYEEAFSASASCFFKPHVIDWYRSHAEPPVHQGYLHSTYDTPAFQSDKDGVLKLWKLPDPATTYIIGADTGGQSELSDPYSAYVLTKDTAEVVAHLHGHFEWDGFADQVFLLGLFFNEALLVCENNHRPAVAKRLHRHAYPNLYYYFELDQRKTKAGRTPGYNMNVKTRKAVLSCLGRALRTMAAAIPDAEFWREMETFVWIPRPHAKDRTPGGADGMWKAPQGQHDDRIMSLGLALTQCTLPDWSFQKAPTAPEQMSSALKWFLEQKRLEDEASAGECFLLGVPIRRN